MNMKIVYLLLLGTLNVCSMEEPQETFLDRENLNLCEHYSGQHFAQFDIFNQGKYVSELSKEESIQVLKAFKQHSAFRNVTDTQAFPYYLSNYEELLKHAHNLGVNVADMGINFDPLGKNMVYFTHDESSLNDIIQMSAAEALGVLEQLKPIMATFGENVAEYAPIAQRSFDALALHLQTIGISVN